MSRRRPPLHTPRSVCKLFSDRPAAYVYPNCQICSICRIFRRALRDRFVAEASGSRTVAFRHSDHQRGLVGADPDVLVGLMKCRAIRAA